ncbi:MAG: YkgJ family cysteine cluster protein [Aggregatilineales bacterium]
MPAFATNPCQSCGACCAHFRVSFYWSESHPELGGSVPAEMTQPLDPFRLCMQGTDQKNPRCVALEGEIGTAVNCTIYENRPTPCREFGIDWVDGMLIFSAEDYERCTRARLAKGMPPLLDDTPQPTLPVLPDSPHRQAS